MTSVLSTWVLTLILLWPPSHLGQVNVWQRDGDCCPGLSAH